MTKKLALLSIFIFWTVFVSLVSVGIVFKPQAQSATTNTTTNKDALKGITLNAAEIAKHNTASSCWVILNNKVYDFSSYLNSHPGAPSTITPFCGTDGTAAFKDKGQTGGPDHSSYAYSLLSKYLLGNVGQTFSNGTVPTPTGQTTTPTPKKPTSTGSSGSSSKTLTTAEVAKHNTGGNCWIILSGYVYNVSSYGHSGGSGHIACGRDNTSALLARHPSSYIGYLSPFRIGKIGQSVSTTSTTPTTPSGGTPTPTGGGNDEEDD
jgi:cytochrome b involved in lipid metabolism